MTDILALIKRQRIERGLSQATLASRTGLSVPGIQKLESARGNPSLSTLTTVLEVLSYELRCTPKPADWDALAACGAALTSASSRVHPSSELLIKTLPAAASELSQGMRGEGKQRRKEALVALTLALKFHFPKFYARWFGSDLLLERFAATPMTGRIIKLMRQSTAVLATYL